VSILLFSYYFDIEKTHLVNCGFQIRNIKTKQDGSKEIDFLAYIEETQNGYTEKRETITGIFTFPIGGQEEHDIDFIRTRYESEKKWIFEIRNNKNPGEKVIIGLISETANKNPLGLDICHDEDNYKAELRANNLSQLEQSYVAPKLTQTIAYGDFNEPGYPYGFTSLTAKYDTTNKLFELSDFKQTFRDPIPPSSAFRIEMDIAPLSVTPKSGSHIFSLFIRNLGVICLLMDRIEYKKENDTNVLEAYFESYIDPSYFYNNGFKTNAKLIITGNENGEITIQYGGLTIQGTYDNTKEIPEMSLQSYEDQTSTESSVKWIRYYLDNVKVTYTK
jgi:hypothetical protein